LKTQTSLTQRDALLEALQDLIHAHEAGMGKSAVNLRIELARFAIALCEPKEKE